MKLTILPIAFLATLSAQAQSFGQNQDNEWKKWRITGAVQADVLVPQDDESIGTEPTDNWALTNTYVQLGAVNKYIEAGARLEFTEFPLPGFEKDFKGWGVPFYYVKGNYKGFELTGGTFYDQFGSGLILRTYEERSLGVDNSLRGGRLVIDALKGVRLKALAGQQRRYWETNPAWIYGADAEVSLHDYFPRMMEHNTAFTLGASWVTKAEDSETLTQSITQQEPIYDESKNVIGYVPQTYTHNLVLPEKVGAFDVRANLRRGNWNFLGEYAQKSQDPSFDNGYIYRNGRTLLLSGSYSKRGMSFQVQAKRSEDMAFRSRRNMNLTSSMINHLPAFTPQQTYALATIYPYATQNVPGEWAFQAEGAYTFKKNTSLGGKYGTTLKASFSHVRAGETMMDSPYAPGTDTDYYPILKGDKSALMGTSGTYESNFWKMGDEKYYQELTLDLEKKMSKAVKFNLKYLNQQYNKTVVEGEGGMIKSNAVITEVKWNINRKVALRAELQYLHSEGENFKSPLMVSGTDAAGNTVKMQALDADGQPAFVKKEFNVMVPSLEASTDAQGNPIMVQSLDAQGNPIYHHEGMDWGKDWLFALVEVSVLPHLMFTLSDQYNPSVYDKSTNSNRAQHYFQGLVTYNHNAHTLRVGYGKTRAGYNCSGGVCRYVPAQKGLTVSYSYNF